MLARQTETETESEKSHPPMGDGHAAIPSPPFSSLDLGHARTCTQLEFKPLGPGLEPWSTTWESSDIAIMPTAGSHLFLFFILFYFKFCHRAKLSKERQGGKVRNPFQDPRGDSHTASLLLHYYYYFFDI